jgi:AraC-like DNA-binding protein
VSAILYRSPLVTLGEFRCPAGDSRWHEQNCVGDGDHVVFPGTAVGIRHDGGRMTLADPNLVVFYRSGEWYRRELHDGRGDECLFLIVDREALAALPAATRFAPSTSAAYLGVATLACRLRRNPVADPLAVEEVLVAVTADALGWPAAPPVASDAVEHVRETLATRYAERRSLASIAAEAGVSPFHLARRFRARTGRTLHGYRDQIRLRSALRLLGEPAELSRLALDLGYSSHSHFTTAFVRRFGISPSALRRQGPDGVRRVMASLPD